MGKNNESEDVLNWNGFKIGYEEYLANLAMLSPKKINCNNEIALKLAHEKRPKKNYYKISSLFLVILVTILIGAFISEVTMALKEKNNQRSFKIDECMRLYFINRCSPEDRVPLTQDQCLEWEICINQPQVYVSVDLIIELIINWINKLSFKSIFIIIFITLFFIKQTFSNLLYSSNN